MNSEDVAQLPLIGSIQNSVAMGFLGNQAVCAIAQALGVRVVHVQTMFAGGHGGVTGRSSWLADPQSFRRDVAFTIAQRPGVLIIGYLPKPQYVEIVASQLAEYKGVVLLDPVMGDHEKGMYVSVETARAIVELLVPLAQIITPNKFEADVIIGRPSDDMTEYGYLNALYDLGPESVVVTSFQTEPTRHRTTMLFSNGYGYVRIHAPYYPAFPAHGAGDVFAASIGTFVGLGASPLSATLLSAALTARATANTTKYGGATIDPVAALATWHPLGYQVEEVRSVRFAEKSNVEMEKIPAKPGDVPRLRFAPPRHQVMYG